MNQACRDYYLKNGYYLFKNVIASQKIDALLDGLAAFKRSGGVYYSQSEHNWRSSAHDLDSYGLLSSSFENFTELPWARRFGRSGLEILLSSEINELLASVSASCSYCMWQNMFFDKSTGTVDHIDTWYLDTDPMGQMVAAWVALEDIDGSGGAFHVYPGSHNCKRSEWIGMPHEQFVSWSLGVAEQFPRKAVYMNKGDVLLWHPSLLHGSTSQQVEGRSRKSLTAHYHPIEMKRGGGGVQTQPDTPAYRKAVRQQMAKLRRYGDLPIYARKRRIAYAIGAYGYANYLLSQLSGLGNAPRMLMNREKYADYV